jgi:hypothetical protein
VEIPAMEIRRDFPNQTKKNSKYTVQYIATYGKRKRSTFTAGNLAHLLVFIPARAHNVRNLIFLCLLLANDASSDFVLCNAVYNIKGSFD